MSLVAMRTCISTALCQSMSRDMCQPAVVLDRLWDLNIEGLQFHGPFLEHFLGVWSVSHSVHRYDGGACPHAALSGLSCAGFQSTYGSTWPIILILALWTFTGFCRMLTAQLCTFNTSLQRAVPSWQAPASLKGSAATFCASFRSQVGTGFSQCAAGAP